MRATYETPTDPTELAAERGALLRSEGERLIVKSYRRAHFAVSDRSRHPNMSDGTHVTEVLSFESK